MFENIMSFYFNFIKNFQQIGLIDVHQGYRLWLNTSQPSKF